jgi:hypothetical protein
MRMDAFDGGGEANSCVFPIRRSGDVQTDRKPAGTLRAGHQGTQLKTDVISSPRFRPSDVTA